MEKVVLFYSESPIVKVSMEIYFTEKGQLFFDGYDIGSFVKQIWGDYDYEYTYTIEPNQVKKLYKILGAKEGNKSDLLAKIKSRFSVNEAYSLFGKFLDTHKIKYERFTWI